MRWSPPLFTAQPLCAQEDIALDFELSVTICSWNTQADLRACLASLEKVRHEASFEVVVVDNNSEDGSPDMVANEFPWVVLHRLNENLGFTGGHNYALARRNGAHLLPLNSDTVVHEGAIAQLMGFLNENPKVGVVGPKLLNPDGSLQYSCRKWPNPVAALFRNTFLGRLFPNNPWTRDYLMTDWPHDQWRTVDWVSGAAFLMRKECLDRVGPMDGEYYMFCEDVDWCFQTWKCGYEVAYYPMAEITHAIGRSTDKAPNRMIGRFHRSMLRFYKKNMVPQLPAIVRPLALAAAAIALGTRASIFIVKNRIDDIRLGRTK